MVYGQQNKPKNFEIFLVLKKKIIALVYNGQKLSNTQSKLKES